MRHRLLTVAWWKLAVGAFLTFAELHYFLFPFQRAGEFHTPTQERINSVWQSAFFAIGVWMLWSATARFRGKARSGRDASLWLFAAGAVLEYVWILYPGWFLARWWIVLQSRATTLAFSVLNIGTGPGRGWEWAVPPLPQRIAWWATRICVVGSVFMIAGDLVVWLWRTARRQGRPPTV